MYTSTAASNNTAIGMESLFYNTTGQNNVAVGMYSSSPVKLEIITLQSAKVHYFPTPTQATPLLDHKP
jgi:hypothetical protein